AQDVTSRFLFRETCALVASAAFVGPRHVHPAARLAPSPLALRCVGDRRVLAPAAPACPLRLHPAPLPRHPPPSSPSPYLTANFIADAAAAASPALVNISVGNRRPFSAVSSGSGFIVQADGLILTNTHVVAQAAGGDGTITVTLSDGITKLRGYVEHADRVSDIAVVRVQSRSPLPTVALGTSATLRPGEFVVALGAPLGLSNSVSSGIVSAVQRTRSEIGLRESSGSRNQMEYIQTDAAINSGNSGGPLLNLKGEVIGINTMKAMGMDGIAFAVPIDEVKQIVQQLQKHGRVLRPYLGLKFVELNKTIAADLRSRAAEHTNGAAVSNSLPDSGLYVMHVAPGSPALYGGVRVGDTITGIDKVPIRTTRELIEALSDK
ncbi:MAG: hypothetical protein SGPRY_007389, partial [Prymnesium sp.]